MRPHRAAGHIGRAVLLLLLGPGILEAQEKTDTIWIRTGDRLIGEVKSLSRGLLKYSTDDLGTVSVEWDKIDRIRTRTVLEVHLTSGRILYGALEPGPSRSLALLADTLRLAEVVAMVPIESEFLARLSGYLDLGFSFQKAHSAAQLSTGAKVVYRGPLAETALEITTFLEARDDAAETSRISGALTERLLLKNRWSAGVVVGYDRNEELDLAGRGRLVGFGARMLAQSNRIELRGTAGLVLTRERFFSTDEPENGTEGLVGVSFRAFRYDRPKLDTSLTSQVFPSFSVGGRVRMQHDLRVSYELARDFMLTTTLFDSYDSKPLAEGAPKNDFGTTLAITWTY